MTAFTDRQLAAQAQIEISRLGATWGRAAVREILARHPAAVVRALMIEHMKFAGIFAAGRQLVEWCAEELRDRKEAS